MTPRTIIPERCALFGNPLLVRPEKIPFFGTSGSFPTPGLGDSLPMLGPPVVPFLTSFLVVRVPLLK